jgi:hypothetical protein
MPKRLRSKRAMRVMDFTAASQRAYGGRDLGRIIALFR